MLFPSLLSYYSPSLFTQLDSILLRHQPSAQLYNNCYLLLLNAPTELNLSFTDNTAYYNSTPV